MSKDARLWMHETRPTTFTLVVDDFAIKVMSDNDANHLINVLKADYTITVDNEAMKYIGLTIISVLFGQPYAPEKKE